MHILHPIVVCKANCWLSTLVTTVKPPFFETTYTRDTHSLLKIGYMILVVISFSTSFKTTSWRFGLSIRWHSAVGFELSSISIWCMHRAGSRHLRSLIVYLITLRCFISKASKRSLCCIVKSSLMMTGRALSLPRNLYFKPFDSCFNSGVITIEVPAVVTTAMSQGTLE